MSATDLLHDISGVGKQLAPYRRDDPDCNAWDDSERPLHFKVYFALKALFDHYDTLAKEDEKGEIVELFRWALVCKNPHEREPPSAADVMFAARASAAATATLIMERECPARIKLISRDFCIAMSDGLNRWEEAKKPRVVALKAGGEIPEGPQYQPVRQKGFIHLVRQKEP